MKTKIALVGMLMFVLAAGVGFTVNAESDDGIEAWKEKAMKSEKRVMELEEKMKMGIKARNVDDLDEAPSIDAPHKGGPALIVGPTRKTSVWMTLASVTQPSYAATPTSPYINWTLEGDVWGMKVKVNVMDASATKLVPENATFKSGDRVSIHGTMKEGIITALKVRNHSLADDKTVELTAKIQELLKRMKEICNQITPKPAICGTL